MGFYSDNKKIINEIRVLPQSIKEFEDESDFRLFITRILKSVERNGRYYFSKHMMNCANNTLVLFQYKSCIRAAGLLVDAIKDNDTEFGGYYIFDVDSLIWLNKPMDEATMRSIIKSFNGFGRAKTKISMSYLERIIKYLEDDKVREWIIPCNISTYDLEGALRTLKKIDWHQSNMIKNAKVGDLVYIYCTSPKINNAIKYKGAILAVNKIENIIDDSRFDANRSSSSGPCFTIGVFREYEILDDLTYEKLKMNGLRSKLQGPNIVRGQLAKYLHTCDMRQINIDRFDGDIKDTCLPDFPVEIREDFSDTDYANNETMSKSFYLEYQGTKIDVDEVVSKIMNSLDFAHQKLEIYIKPEDNKIYYLTDEIAGSCMLNHTMVEQDIRDYFVNSLEVLEGVHYKKSDNKRIVYFKYNGRTFAEIVLSISGDSYQLNILENLADLMDNNFVKTKKSRYNYKIDNIPIDNTDIIYELFNVVVKHPESLDRSDKLVLHKRRAKEEVKNLKARKITGKDKEAVVKQRVGQGAFRTLLSDRYDGCSISQCLVHTLSLLRASHIKPWSKSSDEEKVDIDNGFLLCPDHDALFDKRLISFDDDGKIIISDSLDEVEKKYLNVRDDMTISLTEGNKKYLKYHRKRMISKE